MERLSLRNSSSALEDAESTILIPQAAYVDAVRRKAVLPLKLHNAVVCALAENAVHGRGLNVVCEVADKVQEILNRAHILTSVTAPDNGLELPLDVGQLQSFAV